MMRATATRTGYRGLTAAVLLVGGGGLAAATWVGGDHGFAVALVIFYVIAAGIAYLWAGRQSDVGAIMRMGGDERQQHIDRDATAIAGHVMIWAALIGSIVSTARNGDPGAYGVMCAVGGIAYAVTLVVIRRRR